MDRFEAHLCLVSDQAVPNLLPVLDARWRPRRVILAVSPRMIDRARHLSSVIKRRCQEVAVEQLMLPDAFDYEGLSNTFLDFLGQPDSQGTALNVTGGTKLMAVAAQEAFRADHRPVFYVNIDTDEVILLGQAGRSQPLSADMKVQDLLEAHGYRLDRCKRPQVTSAERDVCARLIDHVRTDGRGLGMLNRLAATHEARQQLPVPLSDRERDSQSLSRMIGLFEEAGRLRQQGQNLVFSGEDSRQFVNGGWLELHVFRVLQDLRGQNPGISDVVLSAEILHPDGRTRNELDVVCLLRNTLHIVECKTANLDQEGGSGDDKATEAIYKAEALTKMGGLRTRAMIADYRGALSAGKANRDRARAAGIAIAAAEQLRDLQGLMRRLWLSGPG